MRFARAAIPLVLVLSPTLASGQAVKAGVVTTLEGTVTAARSTGAQPAALKFKDEVLLNDTIATGDRALARVLLGPAALLTVHERSILTLTPGPGPAALALDSGKLALAVAREALPGNQAIELRTPHAIAIVRGSVLIAEVLRPRASRDAAVVTIVSVLRGTARVLPLDPATRAPLGAPVTLTALQRLRLASAAPARVEPISPAQIPALLAGLQPTAPPHTAAANREQLKAQALQTAAALITALLGPPPARERAPQQPSPEPSSSPEAIADQQAFPARVSPTPLDLGIASPSPQNSATAPLIPPIPPSARGTPEITISGARTLAAGQSLKTFNGISGRTGSAPLLQISGGAVTATASVIQANAGASVTLASPLATVTAGSSLNTVNPNLNTVTSTIAGAAGSFPVGVAITPDGTRTYVTNEFADSVSVIDTTTNTVTATAAAGVTPAGVAITPDGTRAYVVNRQSNSVSVIATATNSITGSVAVGSGPLWVAITPDGTRAYVTNEASNSVSAIDTATNTVTATVTVGSFPVKVAITPDGTRAYVTSRGSDTVSVIDTATNTITASVGVGSVPIAVAITPDGTRAYVTNRDSNTVSVIDTATNIVTGMVAVGRGPIGIAITPDGTRAYVADEFSNTVSVINTATNTVTAIVPVGVTPVGIAITPDGTRAYVTNENSATVSVLDVNPGGDFFSVAAGASVISTGTGPLIRLDTSTLTLGGALVQLRGRTTATELADSVTLTLGTDQPLQLAGVLVETSGATVTAQKGVHVDTALLAASAPLLDLTAGSSLTTSLDTIDLSLKAKVTSLGPLLRLDASTLTVTAGAALNVAGGSLLRVTGDLLLLRNASTLRLLNGPLLRVSGNSVVNVSGALAAFGGSGGNQITLTNTLCSGACTSIGGVSVFLTDGATAANVSIGPTPFRNSSLGSVVKSNPSTTAVISVSGASSKVTITAP